MIKNGLAFLCLIAFASNALAHVVFLTGVMAITLAQTWPFHLM